jgi:glycosyltransferase involved in cell wall biosynthesis
LTSPYYLPFVLRKEIKNFDIIHIHEHRTPLAVFVHYYAKKYDIPYVLQSHGSVLKIMRMDKLKTLFDKIFGYAILRDASKLIAVSNFEVDQYKQMNVPEEKITVIPNGIDLDSFKNLPPKGTFREKFSISEKHIILFLGRINEIKGIDFLIRSYAKLNDEIEDTVLIIAGSDDGYKSRAESLITELNLENKVKFVGYISGVDNLAAYVDADVLVYPSIFEIFGLVPFEAIMCGTPVIVTEECGCGEIIKEINCGLVVKYGDIADLKEKIYFCIRNQNDLAKLIDKGRKYIYLNFDYNCITDKLTAVFAKPNKK